MSKVLCIGGPFDGQWMKAPEGHGLVHAYNWTAYDWTSGAQVDQHTYERRRIGASLHLATRAGAHEWTVLVHLSLGTAELDAWLATQGGPVVKGPKPRLPDVPCLPCPDRWYCMEGLCRRVSTLDRWEAEG